MQEKIECRVMLEDTPYYYDPTSLLGKGGYGTVYLGGKFFTDEKFAVKEINLKELKKKGHHTEDVMIQ